MSEFKELFEFSERDKPRKNEFLEKKRRTSDIPRKMTDEWELPEDVKVGQDFLSVDEPKVVIPQEEEIFDYANPEEKKESDFDDMEAENLKLGELIEKSFEEEEVPAEEEDVEEPVSKPTESKRSGRAYSTPIKKIEKEYNPEKFFVITRKDPLAPTGKAFDIIEYSKDKDLIKAGKDVFRSKYINMLHYIYTKVLCRPPLQKKLRKMRSMEQVVTSFYEYLPECKEYYPTAMEYYYSKSLDQKRNKADSGIRQNELDPKIIDIPFKKKRDHVVIGIFLEVTENALKVYLRNHNLINMLVETGDKKIIYKSGDPFLGDSGYNVYGRALENIRKALQETIIRKATITKEQEKIQKKLEKEKNMDKIEKKLKEIIYQLKVFYDWIIYPRPGFSLVVEPFSVEEGKWSNGQKIQPIAILTGIPLNEDDKDIIKNKPVTLQMVNYLLTEILGYDLPSDISLYSQMGVINDKIKSDMEDNFGGGEKISIGVVDLLSGFILRDFVKEIPLDKNLDRKCNTFDGFPEMKNCTYQSLRHVCVCLSDWLEEESVSAVDILTAMKIILPRKYKPQREELKDLIQEYEKTIKEQGFFRMEKLYPDNNNEVLEMFKKEDDLNITEIGAKVFQNVATALRKEAEINSDLKERLQLLSIKGV